MSGNMQQIKRRIKSIDATHKITKAMELVATSKLAKSRNQLTNLKPYFENVNEMVKEILSNDLHEVNSIYLNEHNDGKDAYIVINSSLGLCGGYNANVYKLANEVINNDNSVIYTIGSKATSYFLKHYKDVDNRFEDLNNTTSYEEVVSLINTLLHRYEKHEICSIKIIYTEFVNNLTFVPKVHQLLPVVSDNFEEKKDLNKFLIFEPNPTEVLNSLIPMYLQSVTYGYLVESITSENASRRMSMENANDNATELKDDLLLKYNQARQTAITNEISEIIAGANVL